MLSVHKFKPNRNVSSPLEAIVFRCGTLQDHSHIAGRMHRFQLLLSMVVGLFLHGNAQ